MTDTAEESLLALARDLVEEISAGRALELASGWDPGVAIVPDPALDELELADHQRDLLELASFRVRPFQRRSPSGKPEQVHSYQEMRKPGVGLLPSSSPRAAPGAAAEKAQDQAPRLPTPGAQNELGAKGGWIPENDWLKGEREWKAKGEAAWKKHEWKGDRKPKTTQQVFSDIRDTRQQFPGKPESKVKGADWLAWEKVDKHLDTAQKLLTERGFQAGQIDQDKVAQAYHHLAQAHEHIVSHIVPHAQPEHYPDIAQHLQRIAGHMQDLDQAMGANPQATRQLLGTGKEALSHAGEARRERESAGRIQDAQEEARQAQIQYPGTIVQDHRGQRAMVVSPSPRGPSWVKVVYTSPGEQPQDKEVEVASGGFDLAAPEPKTGAAAVHSQLGGHLIRQPGDSVSGHAHAHVPKPFPPQPLDTRDLAQVQAEEAAAGKAQETALKQETAQALREEKLQNAALERQGIAPPGSYAPLTDSQFAVHARNVEKALTAAIGAGMATDQAYTLDGKGQVWEPDRAIAHGEIIKGYLDQQVNVPSQRAALFMGGLPGAGKSALLNHHPDISLKDYAIVNLDDFKEELANRGMVPPVEGLSPMESATLIHEESVHLANLAAAELQRRGKNLAFDVTMKSKAATEPRIAALKGNGYHVTAVFVDVPVERSAQRVTKRYRSQLEKYRAGTDPLGGRYVPESVIAAGEHEPGVSKAKFTFDRLRSQFDRWELYDGKEGVAKLAEKSGSPKTPGISSVEDLMRAGAVKGYIGNTEKEARAAERGEAGD